MNRIFWALIVLILAASVATAAETTLSVFMAKDAKSEESGFGAALSVLAGNMTDLSYMDLGDFTLAQFGQLAPKQLGPFKAYFGFVTGFAKRDAAAPSTLPDGWESGLALILGKTELAYGMSLEVRATSLSHDFDPIAWFSDPDLLILGAGLSYKF